jgi:dipeptidyl aminopeptidase/acylaminoacyl peptidase
MKRLFSFSLLLAFLCIQQIGVSQSTPIIDREIFFGDPEISGGQLSPDGQYLSFIKPYMGERNIWVKKLNESFESAIPVTADTTRPISGYFWSRDSKYILYVQDKGGDENFHVYAVDPSEGSWDGASTVPRARDITDFPDVRAAIYSVPKSKPGIMLVGMNDRDQAWHDLYEVNIASGERTLLYENTERITGWNFDWNDELKLASRSTEDGGTEILRVNSDGSFEVCLSCEIDESCGVSGFFPNNEDVYLISNKGADVNFTSLFKFNPATESMTKIESDPKGEVDFGGLSLSEVTKKPIATIYVGDKRRLYFKDKEYEEDYNLLKKKFKGSEISMGSSTDDEQMFLIYVNDDTDPGAAYLFDRKTKDITFQYKPRPELPTEHLSEMTPVRYESYDGLEIPAYLTLPKGLKAKNLPAILVPHGGPWARDNWGYNSFAQFLANRGYAVLQMNFRGSTGYGKEFLYAGDGEWGRKMQDDITAGVDYLVQKGIADPDRVGIMGGSYGGYAVLAGLTYTPDKYAAGIDIVGPSNLITLMESIPPYWESFRKYMYKRMADPNTEAGAKWMKERSPLNYADQIKVPLLVVQGANDPRVKKAEADQIVIAMRELNLPVEYLCAPDEGHGFRRPENNMAFLAAAEKFLAEHLGGRYQESMPENIANRLKEITVDINSVKLAEAISEEELNSETLMPIHPLVPATYKYKMKIQMGANEIPMDMTRTISEEDGKLKIEDLATMPMGNMSDVSVLDQQTLAPLSRAITQGPVKMNVTFEAAKVSCAIDMNGTLQNMEKEVEGQVLSDGGILEAYLSTIELQEGHSSILRVYDPQKNDVKLKKMNVVGKDFINKEDGSGVETMKIEITNADGSAGSSTYWIFQSASDGNYIYKTTAIVPEMGGATVTSQIVD